MLMPYYNAGYYVEYGGGTMKEGDFSLRNDHHALVPVPHTVSFVSGNPYYTYYNGNNPDPQTVWTNGLVTDPAPGLSPGTLYPQYGQQVFLGWFEDTDPQHATPFDFLTPVTAANVNAATRTKTLYARWDQGVKVDFTMGNEDYNGPALLTQYLISGTSPSDPGTFPDPGPVIGRIYPQYGNREFLGWYTQDQQSDPLHASHLFTFPPAPSPDTVTTDTRLYGHWQQYVTVTFANLNGNDDPGFNTNAAAFAPQTFVQGGYAADPVTAVPGALVIPPPGFTFYGWSADPVMTYRTFTPATDDYFTLGPTVSANTVIYGVWSPDVYSVAFDPWGGTWVPGGDAAPKVFEYVPANNPVGTVSGNTLPYEFDPALDPALSPGLAPPATVNLHRPGHTFAGWDSPVVTQPAGNKTYRALWAPVVHDILYVFNGTPAYPVAPPAVDYPQSYSAASTFPLPVGVPTRGGYLFLGYTVKDDRLAQAHPTLP